MKTETHGAGYYFYHGPEVTSPGNCIKDDFLVCGHCETGMLLSAWRKAGGHCFACDSKLCYNCTVRLSRFGCEAIKRKLDRALTDQHRREQNARI